MCLIGNWKFSTDIAEFWCDFVFGPIGPFASWNQCTVGPLHNFCRGPMFFLFSVFKLRELLEFSEDQFRFCIEFFTVFIIQFIKNTFIIFITCLWCNRQQGWVNCYPVRICWEIPKTLETWPHPPPRTPRISGLKSHVLKPTFLN